MARMTRRTILKLSGAGAVAARTGGLAAILATGRAPAFAQVQTVHWLRWADFVPASDQLLSEPAIICKLAKATPAPPPPRRPRDGDRRPAARLAERSPALPETIAPSTQ